MKKQSYTVKHVLNHSLKPIHSAKDNTNLYPVYCQLIFKRKNYMFKSIMPNYYAELDDIESMDRQKMDFEVDLITSIIDYEILRKGEKFDVPGFADKYNHYRMPVTEIAERLLIGRVEHIARANKLKYKDALDYRYSPGKIYILLEMINNLVPDLNKVQDFQQCQVAAKFWAEYKKVFTRMEKFSLDFPLVIDWIIEDHRDVMIKVIKYKDHSQVDLLQEYLEDFDTKLKEVTVEV